MFQPALNQQPVQQLTGELFVCLPTPTYSYSATNATASRRILHELTGSSRSAVPTTSTATKPIQVGVAQQRHIGLTTRMNRRARGLENLWNDKVYNNSKDASNNHTRKDIRTFDRYARLNLQSGAPKQYAGSGATESNQGSGAAIKSDRDTGVTTKSGHEFKIN